MPTFGILCGGGPAPGLNGVIGAATLTAARHGARVLGILNGFQWLMRGDAEHVVELRPEDVARIHLQGGSILHTSRANPTKQPEDLASVVKTLDTLAVDYLITIGGDDTAFSARRVAETAGGRIKVAHVPKTIDNDLPLPPGVPTFGYETAREHATAVVERIQEDCCTTGRWFFLIVMGRTSGSLALGSGMAAGATATLIPEEFTHDPISLESVVRTLEGSIVKRLAAGHSDGVAVIAEGIAARLNPDDLKLLKDTPRDEHGHIRLAEVPLGKVLRTAVQDVLAARGVKVAIGEKDVGYELRCGYPSAFDRQYTRDLGFGAVRALLAGESDVMVTRRENKIELIPFAKLMDPKTGRTRVRLVDTDCDSYRAARALQWRVEKEDLADERKLALIARAANLSLAEARVRYAPIV